jgi:hypothetical protein
VCRSEIVDGTPRTARQQHENQGAGQTFHTFSFAACSRVAVKYGRIWSHQCDAVVFLRSDFLRPYGDGHGWVALSNRA